MSNSTEKSTEKKTAGEIFIEAFLRDVEEKGTLPWQRPYQVYNAFNWVSEKPYRGVNRIFLPFGEYITMNQVKDLNKKNGTNYRFVKKEGTPQWYPVVFFKENRKATTKDAVESVAEDMGNSIDLDNADTGFLFRDKWGYSYYKLVGDKYEKRKNVLQYYNVTQIQNFVDPDTGATIPSKVERGDVVITVSEPREVIDDYVKRSGVKVNYESYDVPCYIPAMDMVQLNPKSVSQEAWFSTAFHEFGHSTGAKKRLNREGIVGKDGGVRGTDTYAVEECIAEICAALCCSECGVCKSEKDFETSGTRAYENSLAYVQGWKKRIKDWGSSFIYVCSQAEKAFQYIMGEDV